MAPISVGANARIGPTSNYTIVVILGPYDPPVVVACQAQAENPKSAGALCAHLFTFHNSYLSLLKAAHFKIPPRAFYEYVRQIEVEF